MDSFEQPTSEQLNELLRMLDEGRNLGFETFRGKLLKRARECDWRWLPPTKPQQWFNRTALNIYTSWTFGFYQAVQHRLDGNPMQPPPGLRQVVAKAIEDGKHQPD